MTDLRSFVALHPPGACRTTGGGTGTYSERWGLALPECEAACKPDPHCHAFEFAQYLARTGTSKCELHSDRIAFAAPVYGAACYVKSELLQLQQASYGKMATPPPVMAAAAVPAQAAAVLPAVSGIAAPTSAPECARLANAWFDLASTARLRLHNNALLPGVRQPATALPTAPPSAPPTEHYIPPRPSSAPLPVAAYRPLAGAHPQPRARGDGEGGPPPLWRPAHSPL